MTVQNSAFREWARSDLGHDNFEPISIGRLMAHQALLRAMINAFGAGLTPAVAEAHALDIVKSKLAAAPGGPDSDDAAVVLHEAHRQLRIILG